MIAYLLLGKPRPREYKGVKEDDTLCETHQAARRTKFVCFVSDVSVDAKVAVARSLEKMHAVQLENAFAISLSAPGSIRDLERCHREEAEETCLTFAFFLRRLNAEQVGNQADENVVLAGSHELYGAN